MAIRTHGVSFRGIYGTATTINGHEVPIQLNGATSMSVRGDFYSGKITLKTFSDDGLKFFGNYNPDSFERVTIDKVDGGSTLSCHNVSNETLSVGTLKDYARLTLDKSSVDIDRTLGKEVTIKADGSSSFTINTNSGFQLEGLNNRAVESCEN